MIAGKSYSRLQTQKEQPWRPGVGKGEPSAVPTGCLLRVKLGWAATPSPPTKVTFRESETYIPQGFRTPTLTTPENHLVLGKHFVLLMN